MKKVMILTAAVLALSYATPQFANATKVQNEIAVNQVKEVKFTEIKVEELPAVVSKSISDAYAGYKIDKAFVGDDTSYKINVSMGDLKQVLLYKASGELIKAEKPGKY
jgi:hypothetical protein